MPLPDTRPDPSRHTSATAPWLRALRGLFLLVLAALPVIAGAAVRMVVEDHTLSGWDADDGLPHNLVHAIAQDGQGFIWVATWEGAARFNGRSFTAFDRENTPGAELSGVFNFIVEDDGSMLVGTADGVYQRRNGRWIALADGVLAGRRVDAMVRARDGTLWVAALNHLYQLDAAGHLHELREQLGLPDARITALVRDDDALLIGTEQGLFRAVDGRATPWGTESGAGMTIRQLASDRQGGWYLATDHGVWRVLPDGSNEHVRPGRRADAVLLDRNGTLWISESGGAVIRRDPFGAETALRVPGTLTAALVEDMDGLIWVGSSAGLFQISRGAAQGVSGSEGYVRSVMQTGDGAIWIGDAAGLQRLHHGVISRVHQHDGNGRDSSVPSLAQASTPGSVWGGTYDKGVFLFGPDGRVRQRIDLNPGRTSPMVRAVLEDASGTVWVGTATHGLYRYRDGELVRLTASEGLPGDAVQVVFEDPKDGAIWVGTSGGMARIAKDDSIRSWAEGVDVPAQTVFDFLRDKGDGSLWIASNRGLLRMRGDHFDVYDHGRGLPRDKVFRIIDDGHGFFWLPSNRGVFRVARSEIEQVDAGTRQQLSVVVVDQTDGMPGSQGNGGTWPAGWRTRAGNLMFPTATGLGLIEPDRVEYVRRGSVPVVLEEISIDGELVDTARPVSLPAGAQRLSVGYSGLDFRAPERVRYRYRMRGFDPDWIEAGARTEAVYTNLPPGDYIFEVQAMRMPVEWSALERIASASMPVHVTPPFWRHWGFIAAVTTTAVLLLAGAWWLRSAHFRRRQRQLNRIIELRTRELTEKNLELEAHARERDELMRKLAHQASHDALTELPNRRAADRYLEEAVNRAREQHHPLCVALLDLDHFKAINDNYGHEAGDQMLQVVAQRLRNLSGGKLFSSRHGGEEFLLVLELEPEASRRALQQLRADIASDSISLADGRSVGCTVSIGLACYGDGLEMPRHLLSTADRNLYVAKGQGRNRLIG